MMMEMQWERYRFRMILVTMTSFKDGSGPRVKGYGCPLNVGGKTDSSLEPQFNFSQ